MPTKLRLSSKKFKSLDFYVLRYMCKNRNIPFVTKTLHYALKEHDFKLKYMNWQLLRLSRIGFITVTEKGMYIFTQRNLHKIKQKNPELAKQINRGVKLK